MKRIAFFVLTAMIMAGCVERITVFAPRRSNSEEHRSAASSADCRACHDAARLLHHSPADDCLRCHKLNPRY